MIRFPAEWEPQSAVIIAWPHHSGDFTDLSSVEAAYRFIATTISRFQPLIIICKDAEHQEHILTEWAANQAIHFIQADYNDIWVRDTVFLSLEWQHSKATLQLVNFVFNGWGNKYPHAADDALNLALFAHPFFKGHPTATVSFVLEGGSVESDGQGTVMTTKNCLFNPNRNPNLSQDAIASQVQNYLGATRILWVEQDNLAGDDTDAHIDTLARFCDAGTIAYSSCDDSEDAHYQSLKNMEAQLKSFKTEAGEPYKLVALPLPKAISDEEGQRLPANYSNFLIINGAVLVPVYDDAMDAVALKRLATCFPDREIIAVPCRPLVHQYGSLHCASMQVPAFVKLNINS
ncbi:agmatine deiminase family protein [Methylicorpusculum sp.]|uniref:agmatine deiminase family protein n=1 Tax=Methylicorpusculum sp. TaxID=2713644 RepID=UPI00272FC9FD|nr:agmatine deiminase family protein [Methylicorpusculum sp.]MDP2180448.1 agmatine deiminase family protein [Methylicorpusculum sp.]MDP3530848.1 agmatine deiminase family protein [Methylicorpusculum sp.]MDZ4153034.1 agmatine deiminase family protein [Methylicorpusculum sp.]